MGRPKALLELEGRSFLARALEAAAAYPSVVVASDPLVLAAARTYAATAASAEVPAALTTAPHVPRIRIVLNEHPERGMTHSFALAQAAFDDSEAACAVLLVDTPLVDAALVARIFAARGADDIAYPVRAWRPGHPVVFGPRPRAALAQLPDGDTLRALRDDPRFTCMTVPISDDAPFTDVDTPDAFATLTRRPE